jgi:flagellar biosynthetic protein FliO
MRQCLALFLFFFTPLLADDTAGELTVREGQSYNYWSEFVNMLVTLAFVLILIFITVWLLKKIMRSRVQTLNRCNGIKILERRPLNPKASLYLIDILGKGIVVSESQAGIHLITEFPDTVKIEELFEQLQGEQKERPSFGETMSKKFRKIISKDAR